MNLFYDFAELKKCGETLKAPSGRISSPDEDNDGNYENLMHCLWTIEVEASYIIEIHIPLLDIEISVDCNGDRLQVNMVHFYHASAAKLMVYKEGQKHRYGSTRKNTGGYTGRPANIRVDSYYTGRPVKIRVDPYLKYGSNRKFTGRPVFLRVDPYF